jgi:alpha-ribazole phosphatase/probable phosphoglycerate mutase
MAWVILVRHGQTDENVSGRISGQGPVPLNSRGQEQARLAAEVLAPLGVMRLCSSPVVRAHQTAAMLDERLRLGIEEVADLREVGYGSWEGKQFNDIRGERAAQQVFQNPLHAVFPKGESLLGVQQRGVRFIESIRYADAGGPMVLVSHGDTIRTALAHYLGLAFYDYRRIHIDIGALSVVDFCGKESRVKAVNFVPQAGKMCLKSFSETWQKTQTLTT